MAGYKQLCQTKVKWHCSYYCFVQLTHQVIAHYSIVSETAGEHSNDTGLVPTQHECLEQDTIYRLCKDQ